MPQWAAAFSGTYGGSYRLYVDVQLVGQEVGNNRSLIRYNAWVDRISSNGGRIWDFGTKYGNTNINGHNPQRALGGYDSSGPGRIFTMAQNEDYWIGHDGAGNAVPTFGANMNLDNLPYVGSAALSNQWALPNIPRYANITQAYIDNLTDVSLRINWAADRHCDYVSWWCPEYDGGGHHDIPVNGAGLFQIGLGNNLQSNKTYNIKVAVRNSASGFWTEAGWMTVTTNEQGRIVDVGVM